MATEGNVGELTKVELKAFAMTMIHRLWMFIQLQENSMLERSKKKFKKIKKIMKLRMGDITQKK